MPHRTGKTAAPAPSAPPPALREGLSVAKREQILQGAMHVFTSEGFGGASMEQVAKHSGVSKGTLYNYFDSKQALFAVLIAMECDKLRGLVFSLDGVRAPPEAVLMQVGLAFMQSTLRPHEMAMARTVLAESHKFPELGRAFESAGPELGALSLGRYLRGLADQKLLAIDDELLAAHQFIGLCDAGMSRRAHLQIEQPTEAQISATVAAAVRLFLKGYAV